MRATHTNILISAFLSLLYWMRLWLIIYSVKSPGDNKRSAVLILFSTANALLHLDQGVNEQFSNLILKLGSAKYDIYMNLYINGAYIF
jgi:hypothetical protein